MDRFCLGFSRCTIVLLGRDRKRAQRPPRWRQRTPRHSVESGIRFVQEDLDLDEFFDHTPSAHACVSGGNAGALSYLFPQDAAFFQAQAVEAAESRIWSGIHFRSDLNAGLALAQKVTQAVVDRVQQDGSQ